MVSFAHLADVHLGHAQYGLDQRREDMRESFVDAVDRIIEEGVDFALLAGDLFHSRDVDAETLDVAESQLGRLNEEGTEVIAVEGNHDAALYRKELSWMEYLHKKGLLTLLAARFDGGGVFTPLEPGTEEVPGYVDREGVRIFGVQWLGQRFSERVPKLIEGIRGVNASDEPETTILVAHFGVSGQIPGAPGVSGNKARELGGVADYVATGHFHKRYEVGSIYNPGSLETHSSRQAEWGQGLYFADVVPGGGVLVRHEGSKQRPCCSLSFDVSDSTTAEEMESKLEDALEEERREFSRAPIVFFTLKGKLHLSRDALDLDDFSGKVRDEFGALHVVVSDATESKVVSPLLSELESEDGKILDEQGRLDRDKLESSVFDHLVAKDSRYDEEREEVAGTVFMTKRMLLSGEDPASVAEELKAKRRELFPVGSKEGKK